MATIQTIPNELGVAIRPKLNANFTALNDELIAATAAVAGKAATSHTHSIADSTGLQAALDGKEASGVAASTLAGHVAAGDPHPAYQLESALASDVRAQVAAMLGSGANVTLTPSGSGASLAITISAAGVGGGSGTVTSVAVATANGVSGSVATATSTPVITIALGAITPTSVVASGNVTGANLSGTNTGDQTTITGNAGTATKLATPRTINGLAFDGTANITVPADANTLGGTTLASNVTASSLLSAAGGAFGTAAFAATSAFEAAGGIATHAGLPDPHTQYALESSLGDAAGKNVGTGAGTVAAGDHNHSGVYSAAGHLHSGDALTPASVVSAGSVTGSNLSGTNTGDSAVNTLYSSLVTNATHTGDVTGSGALTLATVNSNVGSFGSATAAGTFTVNAKGLITAASSTTVTPAVGSITGLGTGVGTALAVAVGSAGAPVTFNGAGGTPSSLTLTNATGLPTAGLVDDAVTLAKMAAGTAGNLITYDASGNPAAVATGTSGHVLTSNGAGAAPTFQAAAGGGASIATNAQTIAGISTTTAVPPSELFRQWAHVSLCIPSNNLYAGAQSGAGAAAYIKYQARQVIGPNASTAGYAIATRTNDNCHIWNLAPGLRTGYVTCNRSIHYFGLSVFTSTPVSGVVVRSTFGKDGTTVGDLGVRGIGWRKTGAGALELVVHNGTTLTAVTSSFTPVTDEAFSWAVTNDGSGNCALYVNGSSVATTSAGPSGSGNSYGAAYNGTIVGEEIDCSAGTHSSSLNVNWINGGFAVGA